MLWFTPKRWAPAALNPCLKLPRQRPLVASLGLHIYHDLRCGRRKFSRSDASKPGFVMPWGIKQESPRWPVKFSMVSRDSHHSANIHQPALQQPPSEWFVEAEAQNSAQASKTEGRLLRYTAACR